MRYDEERSYTICAVMESAASFASESSAPNSFVTPSQQILLDRNSKMLDALLRAISEHGEEGGLVATATVWNARRLLQLLPVTMPSTDAYISEVESVCFDWDECLDCQLSLMVQKNNRIAYAASIRGDRLNGCIAFSPETLPQEIIHAIARWQQGQLHTE